MTSSRISDFEMELIEAAVDGEIANFMDRKNPSGNPTTVVIRGYIIRHLLIGLPLPTRANRANAPDDRYTIASNGVRVRGVRIEGIIDLSDSSGHEGNGCFPLLLEDCILTGEDENAYQDPSGRPQPALNARHARLSRLSLKNCRAGFIDLTDAELMGDLELDGLQALGEGGQCRVEARSIRIDGSIKASTVKLNLRQAKLEKSEASPADYALQLAGSEITGNVNLRPQFVADGGVNIANAHINGDLWADGAHLIAQGNLALNGQATSVDGVVGFTCLYTRVPTAGTEESNYRNSPPERFRADGGATFLTAELGSLELRGAILRRKEDERRNGFICAFATVQQVVNLSEWRSQNEQGQPLITPFEADCFVSFTGTKITGSLVAMLAKFDAPAEEIGFEANNLEVGGDLELSGVQADKVSLQGAKITGSLRALGAKFDAPPAGYGFFANNLEVGGDLMLNNVEANNVSLWGAKITGTLEAAEAKFHSPPAGFGLRGNNLKVGGDLYMVNTKSTQISLAGANITQSLNLNQTRLSSIHAQNIKVGGSVHWSGELNGAGNFQGACIEGELRIGESKQNPLQLVHEEGSSPVINLEDSKVTRDLKVWGFEVLQRDYLDRTKYPSVRFRTRKLACYENWELGEAIFEGAGEAKGFAAASLLMERQGGTLIVLDGLSKTIHSFNSEVSLLLKTKDQAFDYLKFFCAHIWADEGAFRIVESPSEVKAYGGTTPALATQVAPIALSSEQKDGKWEAEAFCIYAQKLFKSSFRINPDGNVEMLSDTHIADLTGEPLVTYSPPVRFIRDTPVGEAAGSDKEKANPNTLGREWNPPPAMDKPDMWSELPPERAAELEDRIIGSIRFRAIPADGQQGRKSKINLRGSKVGSLEDNHGRSWGGQVILDLEGFEYDRFDVSPSSTGDFDKASVTDEGQRAGLLKRIGRKILQVVMFGKNAREFDAWQHRVEWLNKQYNKLPPTRKDYKSQPYEQVAKVLRAQGDSDQATRILIEKLRLDRKIRFSRRNPKRFGYWLADRLFGYGILWAPVFLTFLICWLAGWLLVDLANYGHLRWPPVGSHGIPIVSSVKLNRPILVVDAASVSTVALTDDAEEKMNAPTAREAVTLSPDGRFVKEIRCGDQIEPALYALDVFVPLLDLKQESKCTISAEHEAWPWRVAKSVYAILGWIVTSALILTISGVVRRHVER